MRFYRIVVEYDPAKTKFARTLKIAHATVKALYKPWWDETYIDEVEVQTDKAGVTELVCGGGPIVKAVLASWTITKRGGLRQVEAEQ